MVTSEFKWLIKRYLHSHMVRVHKVLCHILNLNSNSLGIENKYCMFIMSNGWVSSAVVSIEVFLMNHSIPFRARPLSVLFNTHTNHIPD